MNATRIKIGNTTALLRRTQAAHLASRQAAAPILPPEAVSGKVSPAKVLMTTIDGQARPTLLTIRAASETASPRSARTCTSASRRVGRWR